MDRLIGFVESGLVFGLLYGLLAAGIVLVYKGTRVINFAQPYFGLQAAFIAWWLTSSAKIATVGDQGIYLAPFEANSRPRLIYGVVVAIVLTALNGAAIEHSIFRRLRNAPRLVSLVATIALAQGTVGGVALLFNRTEEQASTFRQLPQLFTYTAQFSDAFITGGHVRTFVIVPVICALGAIYFKRSKFGVAIRAAAENGEAARLLGISVDKVSAFTWIVGSILAAIAGILVVDVRNSLDVATLSTGFLVRGLAAALLGGLTSLPGAIVGGLFVGVGESVLNLWLPEVGGAAETLLFAVIIVVLLFRPGGLFGQVEQSEDKVGFVPTLRELPEHLRNGLAARGLRWIGVGVLGVMILMSFVTTSKTNFILTEVVLFALVGVSLTVLMGYAGQISLGHWGIAGMGAFTTANLIARADIPWLLTLPITFLVGMMIAVVIGAAALRIRGLYLAIATLAFNLSVEFYFFKSEWFAGSTAGIIIDRPKLGPIDLDDPSNRPMFFVCVAVLLACLWVARNLARSRTGRAFFAVRENEKAAATLGVGVTDYKLVAFGVSGGMAALAGALFATNLGLAESVTWTTQVSLTLVAMAMIGGLGALSGSVAGAFLVFGLPRLVEFENPWIVPIATGILLLVVLVRARGGVAGLLHAIRSRLIVSLEELPGGAASDAPAAPATSG